MEKLIFLAIAFVIYLLHEWWKARNNRLEEGEPPSWPGQPPRPPTGTPAPPARTASWEEELRRLLEGESSRAPQPPPPPSPAAPPPLRAERPATPPTPIQRPLASRPAMPPARARPATAPFPGAGEDPDMQRGLPVQLPGLDQSAQAYQRASRLEDRVAEQLRRVHDQVTSHKKMEVRKETSPEVRQALGMLRVRSSQRAAIIAAVVLGPPRALES